MPITLQQLQRMAKDEKLFAAMATDNDIDPARLSSIENLSDEDIKGLQINSEYWMRNYASYDMTYESQYEYEINPIHIYGIRGLYLVKVMEEEGVFFNTKRDAIAYADQAVKVFFIDLDWNSYLPNVLCNSLDSFNSEIKFIFGVVLG